MKLHGCLHVQAGHFLRLSDFLFDGKKSFWVIHYPRYSNSSCAKMDLEAFIFRLASFIKGNLIYLDGPKKTLLIINKLSIQTLTYSSPEINLFIFPEKNLGHCMGPQVFFDMCTCTRVIQWCRFIETLDLAQHSNNLYFKF